MGQHQGLGRGLWENPCSQLFRLSAESGSLRLQDWGPRLPAGSLLGLCSLLWASLTPPPVPPPISTSAVARGSPWCSIPSAFSFCHQPECSRLRRARVVNHAHLDNLSILRSFLPERDPGSAISSNPWVPGTGEGWVWGEQRRQF